MKVQALARNELFDKFKEFLDEKSAEETLISGEGSYYAQYEKAAKRAREEAALEKARQIEIEKEKEQEAVAAAASKPSDKTLNSKQPKPEAKSRNLNLKG